MPEKTQADSSLPALMQEFCEAPFGEHSHALRRLMLGIRSSPACGKYVLVEVEPFRRWRLGRLRDRGQPVELLDTYFDDLEEAERFVFRLRCGDLQESRREVGA
jgi:hypothetical protein